MRDRGGGRADDLLDRTPRIGRGVGPEADEDADGRNAAFDRAFSAVGRRAFPHTVRTRSVSDSRRGERGCYTSFSPIELVSVVGPLEESSVTRRTACVVRVVLGAGVIGCEAIIGDVTDATGSAADAGAQDGAVLGRGTDAHSRLSSDRGSRSTATVPPENALIRA
jgi:hypothetical protein